MKYVLIDNTNNGLLGFCTESAVCAILQQTMVDTAMRVYEPWFEQFEDIDERFVRDDWYLNKKTWKFEPLLLSARNPLYEKRRELFQIRRPIARRLVRMLREATLVASASVWPYIENNLELALRECDPATGIFSDSIDEYAQINEIAPAAAYREIKLKNDTLHSIKMRMFAWGQKFTLDLADVNTAAEGEAFMERLHAKFTKDSSL